MLPRVAPLEAEPQEVEPLGGGGYPGLLRGQGEPKLAQLFGESGTQPLCHRLGRHDEDVVGVTDQLGVQPPGRSYPRSTQVRSSSWR
jgi:hypothetical protein